MTAEMLELKARLKSTWMAGDYGHFAKYLEPGAMEFMRGLELEPGHRLLDVACGAGQIALPAARAGARVTGIDIAANLVDQARRRAQAEGLEIRFDEGDAEELPYADESFDCVASLIGAMFAPRPECVANELVRVCRRDGRIVMANWTPDGFVGKMFRTAGRHVPPPSLMPAPVLWGDESTVRDRFRDGIGELRISRKSYPLVYPFPPSRVVEFFRNYYGPMNKAFSALDGAGQLALQDDLEELWSEHNASNNGGTEVHAEYLLVVAVRH